MKIVNLNEGPLNFMKGVAGAARSRSKNPNIAFKGKRQLGRATLSAKKDRMAKEMLSKWNKQSKNIRSNTGKKPGIKEFQVWISNFMGGRDIGEPYHDKLSSGNIKKYFFTLVDQFYTNDQGKQSEPASQPYPASSPASAAPSKQQMPRMIGRDAQNKLLTAPTKTEPNADAVEAFKSLGYKDKATIQVMMKKAASKGANMNDPADIVSKALKDSLERVLMSKYLAEASTGKNTHLEHIEDLVFNHGYDGAEQAIDYIMQVVSMLSDGSGNVAQITTKWDGAPTIVCGIDPADGKFFVGTKTTFNTEPKLVKNASSLNKWYGDRPELMAKMGLALKVLPKLGIGGVMQGDFMFSRDTITQETINGEKMISFTPNTITYAVPAGSDLAKRMLRAKMGIIFHTAYEGSDLASMEARFGVDVSGLKQSKEVWVDDAIFKDVTGKATLTKAELSKINNTIKAMQATMQKIRANKFNVVIDNKEFSKYIKPYINQLVREGRSITNSTEFLNDFLDFYKGKIQIEIDKIATEKGEDNVGIKNRQIKMQKKEEFLEDNSNAILGVLAIYKRIVEIKLLIIGKLQQVDGLHTFIKDGDGYKVTNPEGFVAIRQDGGVIKLVDRLEFSKQNFNAIKSWKKE